MRVVAVHPERVFSPILSEKAVILPAVLRAPTRCFKVRRRA